MVQHLQQLLPRSKIVFLRKCNKRKWFKRQWLSLCKKKYVSTDRKGQIGLFYTQVSVCVNSCNVRFKMKQVWIVQGLAYLALVEFAKWSSLKAVVSCSVPLIDSCLSFLRALLATVSCSKKGIHLEQGNWGLWPLGTPFLTNQKAKIFSTSKPRLPNSITYHYL